MLTLINYQTEPNLSIKIKNAFNEVKNVLFLWEESAHGVPLHSDIVTITDGVTCHSSINKSISFFAGGVTFKIVDIKTYEILFSYKIENLSFIKGKKILYVSPNGYTGYSSAARNCVYQLLTNGYEVQWNTNICGGGYIPCNIYEEMACNCQNNKIEHDCVIIHTIPQDYERIFKELQLNKSKPIYGSTVWETTKLPPAWVELINRYTTDVISPSSFNKQTFAYSGIRKPIHLWKYDIFPIDHVKLDYTIASKFVIRTRGSYQYNTELIQNTLKENTVYYNISQYSSRKNVDQAVKTFCNKFTNKDSVCLLLKLFFKSFANTEKEIIKYKINELVNSYENHPPIILCLENLNTDELNVIHKLSDVYFTLNRGEGFGLCSYTAKKFGNKVICGDFGSEKEFLDGNDILIPYKLEKPHGMINFHDYYDSEGQLWATFNNDDVISRLKYFKKKIDNV